MTEHHIGRSFPGLTPDIETACPCPKAPCGLVIREQVTTACEQHHVSAAKTIRQTHTADRCPGAPQPEDPAAVALAPLEAAVRADRRAQQTGDRAALRDRIAEALWPLTDWDGDQLNAEAAADAVLAVLSEPTDQAAVRATALSEPERTMLRYALDQAQEAIWSQGGFTEEDQAAVDSLRRLADEAQGTTCPGFETVPNRCGCPCEGCKHNCAAHEPTTPAEDPARIDRLRPEFTEHASIEAIDAQLRRAQAQERRWHIRTEWLISLRQARVEQQARADEPAGPAAPAKEA